MAEQGGPGAFDRRYVLEQAMNVFWSQGQEGALLTALAQAGPPPAKPVRGAQE